jgi:hypothetical protein
MKKTVGRIGHQIASRYLQPSILSKEYEEDRWPHRTSNRFQKGAATNYVEGIQ